MLSRNLHSQRGQAIAESGFFIPLLLLSLFSLIFFSRLGVLSERGQTAVRYANLVTFRHGQSYTIATVFDLLNELLNPTTNQLGPLCLVPNTLTANPDNTISESALTALSQNQPATSGTPPASKQFWKPDSALTPACNPLSVQLTSGTYGVSNLPLSVTSFQVTGVVGVPGYLKKYITLNKATSSMAFLNVATPNMIVACIPGVSIVLTVLADLNNPGLPTCGASGHTVNF